MAIAYSPQIRDERLNTALDVAAGVPFLEDLVATEQLPYLAQLREWAELIVELSAMPGAYLPAFAGVPLRIYA